MRVPVDAEHATWVQRAQDGDTEAFRSLVEAYQVPVYNLCYRMLSQADEAEDASQEVFLRAYRGIRRYDPQRPFGTWLLAIASHYCIDRMRRRRLATVSAENLPPSQSMADPADGPEESLAKSETREQLSGLTRSLAPQERAVIVLRYWYDLSYEEIAGTLSMTESAVKSRLHRARKALAQRLMESRSQAVDVRGVRNEPSAI